MSDQYCHRFLVAFFLCALVPAAGAQSVAAPDPSQWKCANCPQYQGVGGAFTVGVGDVSDNAFRFGDYTGLDSDGPYLIFASDIPYRSTDGRYLDLSVRNLGLDTRAVALEGGRQGRYELGLSYESIPHLLYDNTSTPFLGAGSASLSLPADWMRAGSTRSMPLDTTLQPVAIKSKRETYGFGFQWLATHQLAASVDYHRREKNGTQMLGATFLTASSILPAPVDYRTDEIDAGLSYGGERWFARLAYYGSFFSDRNVAVTWDDPYYGFTPAQTQGRISTPPDNAYQSIGLSGSYRFAGATQLTGSLSSGRATQSDAFVAATVNPDLGAPANPARALDGKVNTLDFDTRITSSLRSGLRLKAEYRRSRRDNRTPQMLYTQAETDVFIDDTRMNVPYGFENERGQLEGDYRLRHWATLRAGVERRVVKRDLQEVARTEEDKAWGRVTVTPHPRIDVSGEVSQANRDGSDYRVLDNAGLPQNPAMRLFNMADRDRVAGRLHIDVRPTEWLSVGLEGELARDDYPQTLLGTYDADHDAYTLDLSAAFPKQVSLYALASQEQERSKQRNSESGGENPDWFAVVTDRTRSYALGFKAAHLHGKYDVGVDLTRSRSTGRTGLQALAPAPPFPDLLTRVDAARAYLRFPLRTRIDLQVGYVYERYRSANWSIDGLTPDTVANLLALGAASYDYDVNLISLSAQYRFDAQ
jgi:MtrB/PioB family decaheme-associated outer membrane protein